MNTKQKKLRKEFIEEVTKDKPLFPDTNAGFRKFLKRKGEAPFNFRKGGLVTAPKLAKRGY